MNITCRHFLAAISRENGTDLPSSSRARIKNQGAAGGEQTVAAVSRSPYIQTCRISDTYVRTVIPFQYISAGRNCMNQYSVNILFLDSWHKIARASHLYFLRKLANSSTLHEFDMTSRSIRKLAVLIYSNYSAQSIHMHLCIHTCCCIQREMFKIFAIYQNFRISRSIIFSFRKKFVTHKISRKFTYLKYYMICLIIKIFMRRNLILSLN